APPGTCPRGWYTVGTARTPPSPGGGPARRDRRRERLAVGADHVAVVLAARLDRALLRGEVHGHEAEPEREAAAPLEIVQQGPGEVAAHIDALPHRLAERQQVLAVVADAQRVVDATRRDRREGGGGAPRRGVRGG